MKQQAGIAVPEEKVAAEDGMSEGVKAEIRARLQPVCRHMSEAMFEELVDKIALNEKRALERGAEKWGQVFPREPLE